MKWLFKIIGSLMKNLLLFALAGSVLVPVTKGVRDEIRIHYTQGTEPADTARDDVNSSSVHGTKATAIYVVDGDTINVLFDGTEYSCRLIGVDTPESVARSEYLERAGKENTEGGHIAKEFTRSLVRSGDTLYLELDVTGTDNYGRLLAYVYLADGRMLQEVLLEHGMARVMTIAPNVKYADHFVSVEKEARRSGAGFWAELSTMFSEN